VIALDYGHTGSLLPIAAREFPTRGTGEAYVRGQSTGVFAGDQQITLSSDGRFLLAVNQGSDTVAVFRIDHRTGALRHVPGSPFKSGGNGPIAIGVSGSRVVVANKGLDPGAPPPGSGNIVSFRLSRAGRLTKVSTVPAPGGPIDAAISPNGSVVFSSEFFAFSLHVLHLAANGTLANGPAGQFQFDPAVTQGRSAPPGFPPQAVGLPFGIGVNPKHPYVYYAGAVAQRIGIYRYAPDASMTFVSAAENAGALATCWLVVTPDGRHMYAANTASQDLGAWSISPAGDSLTRQQILPLAERGAPSNVALATGARSLFTLVLHDDTDAPLDNPADGNFIESYSIGSDGRLRAHNVAPLPVHFSSIPEGLLAVARSSRR
jgi:6-phosphogluconolactonase (cycloisomerase 2 family)